MPHAVARRPAAALVAAGLLLILLGVEPVVQRDLPAAGLHCLLELLAAVAAAGQGQAVIVYRKHVFLFITHQMSDVITVRSTTARQSGRKKPRG